MNERQKCYQAVTEWFEKIGKSPNWQQNWWYRNSPLLDGKNPVDLLDEERFDDCISFARNDLVVLSKKARPQETATTEKSS